MEACSLRASETLFPEGGLVASSRSTKSRRAAILASCFSFWTVGGEHRVCALARTPTPLLFWLPPLEAAESRSSVSLLRLLEPSDPLGHRPIAHAQAVGRCESSDVPISPVQGIGVRCIPQLVAPIDARVGGLHPRDERSRHLDSGWSRPMGAPRPGQRFCACGICIHIQEELADLHRNNQVNAVAIHLASRELRKVTPQNVKD